MTPEEIALKILAGERTVKCPECKEVLGFGLGQFNCRKCRQIVFAFSVNHINPAVTKIWIRGK